MSSNTPDCPICSASMEFAANPFCDMQAQLLHPGATVRQYLCTACGHGLLKHDVPLALLYNSNVALPTDYVNGDVRFQFIASHVDLAAVDGQIVEFGGGPGELAEQARIAACHERATVVDFVNRVANNKLDFVPLDFNADADKLPVLFQDVQDKKNMFLLSHVIEHLFDPATLLRELNKFPNSVIFIEVPDFGSAHALSTLRFSLNHLEHLHYFTARSLQLLLQNVGYEILAFETQAAPRMPALRAVCVPARVTHNAIRDYQVHFATIVQRLKEKILDSAPDVQVWVWGLSGFMAQAIVDLGASRDRIAGIFDTRFPSREFMGLPVYREPQASMRSPSGQYSVVICGSTYSAVQKLIAAKAHEAFPDAEFFAIEA